MRFLRLATTATIGFLASQASLVSSLVSYHPTASLTCATLSDVVRVYYTFNDLATPPVPRNGNPADSYEIAFRVVESGNSAAPFGFPITTIQARDGTGISTMNYIPVTQNVTNIPKDNAGTETTGLNLVYNLPGSTLFHTQLPGVQNVQGYFEIENVQAGLSGVACDTMTGTPNLALVPQQYTINGIKQIVTNAFDVINDPAYLAYIQANPSGANPVYRFDVTPAVNIDGCFNDIDPATGLARIRVPFRVINLAPLSNNEQGVLSIAVADAQGNPNSAWTVSLTDQKGFIGKGFRDSVEPSIVDWIQLNAYGYVFGRLDFPAQGSNITCPDKSDPTTGAVAGMTDALLSIVDYSTFDLSTSVQTWHFLPGAPDNGMNTDARVQSTAGQLIAQAAGTAAPTQAPSAAAKAARKAAAKKACAAAKAAAAAAAAKAAAAAAALAGQDAQHPCILVVPANPLTAAGLATPYVLQSPCTMADTASFVQATILSPSTGQVFAYQPLVIGQGKMAAIKPVVPTLPADAVVGLWFGSNAVFQKLQGANNNNNILTQANCVNGFVINNKLSLFGQTAACNGVNLYAALAVAVFNGLLVVPPLGNAVDGKPCPTLRSFMMVDQDPQDNLQTQYILDFNGNTAINSTANLATLKAAATKANQAQPTVLVNPGDNPLLSRFINPAIGCVNWEIPDLSVPGTKSVTAPMGEVLAAFRQAAPVARMPAGNPMVLDDNGNLNLGKLNAYRTGLAGQNAVTNLNAASTTTFCQNMVGTNGAVRLMTPVIQQALTLKPGPVSGQSTFQFLVDRFAAAVGPGNLKCGALVPGLTNPLAGGAVIAAQSAFTVDAALLVGSQTPDNQAQDPYAELTGQTMSTNTGTGNTFPVAIGGVVVLIIASLVIFKVVQKRKAGNVMATTARECKV